MGKPEKIKEVDLTIKPGFGAQILKAMAETVRKLELSSPDAKHNVGKTLVELYIWDEIAKMAKKRSDDLWDRAEAAGLYRTEGLDPGTHSLIESPGFVLIAKISEPVRRFSADALAKAMKAKYKVPEPMTRMMCDEAKVPGKSNVGLSIAERE